MNLYTRRGDDGTTQLRDGRRVGKDSLRIAACGAVDEANCAVGLACAACADQLLRSMLAEVQSDLLAVGSQLATRGDAEPRRKGAPSIGDKDVARLEGWIDRVSESLVELKRLIVPGGCESASRLHVARGACRRAERTVVRLASAEPVDGRIVPYLNRLGDLLFAAARWANRQGGVEEAPWRPEQT